MSAAVVYEGVPGAQGTLFQGKRFWVARLVPDRKTILDLITQNGGKIVPLEKHADFLIVDQKRNNYPPESLSWQFVKDSVRYGAVQEEDKYRIVQSPAATRPVGSSKPVKSTRTAYTSADDALLAHWVLSHHKPSGNEIYQKLESTNNRHTWQSWRDRWVKKLSKLSPAVLEEMAARVPERKSPTSSSPLASLPKQNTQSAKCKLPASVSRSNIPPLVAPQERPAVGGSNKHFDSSPAAEDNFDEQDDELLLGSVLELERHGSRPNINFFQELAKKHPHHSISSWQRYWAKVESQLRRDFAQSSLLAAKHPVNATHEQSSIASSFHRGQSEEYIASPGSHNQDIDVVSAVGTATYTESRNPPAPESQDQHDDEGAEITEEEESQGMTRKEFYDFFEVWKTHSSFVEPQISGQPFDIWLLWRAVRAVYARGGTEPDWDIIAGEMGFPRETSEVFRQFYSQSAQGFFATLPSEDDITNRSEDGNQEEGHGYGDGGASQHQLEEEEPITDDEIRISLPTGTPGSSRKRQATHAEFPGLSLTPNGRKKRSRLGPNDEIPSTPEEKLGLASFDGFGVSPSLSMKRTSPPASAIMKRSEGNGDVFGSKTRRLEPETQDFGFDDENPARGMSQENEEFDISPSQQLFNDLQAVTPVRLSYSREGGQLSQRSEVAGHRPEASLTIGVEGVQDISRREGGGEAESESQEGAKIAAIDGFIKSFEGFGYSHDHVLTALMSTSLCMPLATSVLKYMKAHKSIPRDWEGVWTENDDERLRRVDSAGPLSKDNAQRAKLRKYWDFLVLKHTQRRIEQRREFFAYMDEVEQSSL
ncbi:transcription factor [Colletotrichum truncatum]|uniref:Transcription factor n=1 Tax=Colletotrichum truncatum TaxID=5467 RepID=A0ACC3YQV8_COLTU|nr:transcription factor [Colletotrichum truncatum]KAF6798964.1 transcription factor [Colletotrichum truncatum]